MTQKEMLMAIHLKTASFTYTIADDGRNVSFVDLATGRNLIREGFCALLTDQERQQHRPRSVSYDPPLLTVTFDNNLVMVLEIAEKADFVTFTLKNLSSDDFHSLAFVNIETDIDYQPYVTDAQSNLCFTTTLMGMTAATRMVEHPGRNNLLRAEGYTHIGLLGTTRSKYPVKAAVIGAHDSKIRSIMKRVTDEIPDGELPKSKKGGAYALDCEDARRTYTTLSAVRLEEVDEVCALMKKLGISQAGIHQGASYRQGDFVVNTDIYPNGLPDFKKVIDRFHEHGVQVGLHPYTFFVGHNSHYLTPVPHEDLDAICELTLAASIDAGVDEIVVEGPTDEVAEIYDYGLVSSPYLKIGHELVRFSGVRKGKPYAFTGCERGALGTQAGAHSAGVKVRQLKEYFKYVAPRADSEQFYEVARNTAEFYNTCGFDMIYLDAIDGVFALEGNEYAWYHAIAFINELFRHLKTDPVFDCCYNPQYTASWYARSRYGALDSGNRGYNDFVDAHVRYNDQTAERMYITPELGWWNLYQPGEPYGWQSKVMMSDEVEYLYTKVLATDCCMSIRRPSVMAQKDTPMLQRYARIIERYLDARAARTLSPDMKAQLRAPEQAFKLCDDQGGYTFRKAKTWRFRAEAFTERRNHFTCDHAFKTQKPFIRIEPLYTTAPYDDPDALVLQVFDESKPIANEACYELDKPDGLMRLPEASSHTGVGVWLYGDGSGTTVRIQLANRLKDRKKGQLDYFIKVDFSGWRSFTFYESQNAEPDHADWPRTEMEYKVFSDVGRFYDAYRNLVDFSQLAFLEIKTNAVTQTGIRLKTIKLLPPVENTLHNPTVTINGQQVTFPVSLHGSSILECHPDGFCEVFNLRGEHLASPVPDGEIPVLRQGVNQLSIDSAEQTACQKRAVLTLQVTE
ncbi:MAG: hypothetical protein GX173_13585 [Ruminococcaceae bacterium]|nr:hypothetical protein [Oscillospiraceae bacterium]